MLEPPVSAINFIWGHLVKTEWLVADVTAIGSLDRAECATYFGGDCGWACFLQIKVVFVVAAPLCDVGAPS